jgi:hypothetical protein
MQTGTSAGMAASGAAGAANGSAATGADLMGRGFNTAIAGNQSAGNLYAQSADLGSRGNLGGWLNAAGGIGYAMGALSSKKVKRRGVQMDQDAALEANNRYASGRLASGRRVARMSDEEALEANNRLQTDTWAYKPGVADEGVHNGPYAEDVNKEFGEEAAPGGKMINLEVMAKNNAKAIAALSKQLEALEEQIEAMEGA